MSCAILRTSKHQCLWWHPAGHNGQSQGENLTSPRVICRSEPEPMVEFTADQKTLCAANLEGGRFLFIGDLTGGK